MKAADILVVGAGVTGLSCARALRAGGASVAVAFDEKEASVSSLAPGFVAGGQLDNFTRVAHAHGEEFAAELWRFGDDAFDALAEFCTSRGVSLQRGERLRLVTSEAELTEARLATAGLSGHSFPTTLQDGAGLFGERVLAVQNDGCSAALVDVSALLRALKDEVVTMTRPAVVRLATTDGRETGAIKATFADGSETRFEIVVLASHLAIGKLVPNLASALVAVGDQWIETTAELPAPWSTAGTFLSANHTYEWAVTLGGGRMAVGGGRYLRPMAGIETTEAHIEPKITQHLCAQMAKIFGGVAFRATGTGAAFLDCRPCDELPIVGPMYGEPRLLVATGFMGQGLSQGFLAGRCLAELALQGSAPQLPRRLWPERLRSL